MKVFLYRDSPTIEEEEAEEEEGQEEQDEELAEFELDSDAKEREVCEKRRFLGGVSCIGTSLLTSDISSSIFKATTIIANQLATYSVQYTVE